MTARTLYFGLALAGVAGLLVTSEGLAETRLMSDPNGVVLPAAPADASALAPISVPNAAQGATTTAPPVTVADPALAAAPTTDTPATEKALSPASGQDAVLSGSATEPLAPVDAPAPSWVSRARQFVAGIVISSGK